jgi:hypothetical protein
VIASKHLQLKLNYITGENYRFTDPRKFQNTCEIVTSYSVRNITKSTPSMHATSRIAHNPELVLNIKAISQMENVQCRRIKISAWVRITFSKTRKIIGHKSHPKFFQKGWTDSRDSYIVKGNRYQIRSMVVPIAQYYIQIQCNLPDNLDERKEWGVISENLALSAETPCSS